MSKKIFSLVFLLFLILAYSQPVFAITFSNPIATGTSASSTFNQVLDRALSWIFPVSIIIGILMIMIGGYYFLFSGGSPERANSGKKVIVSALIGIVVVVLAKGIVNLIRRVFPTNMPPEQLLPTIITWTFGFLLASGVMVLIMAGYILVTSGGNPDQAKKGKRWLAYALIGISIAVLARGIVALVLRIIY